jgi:hypothetical protein
MVRVRSWNRPKRSGPKLDVPLAVVDLDQPNVLTQGLAHGTAGPSATQVALSLAPAA